MTTTPFSKLLIANRGEIACRVIRSARALGYETVAVFSDADADTRHVMVADEAVHIGPSAAAESYLVIEAILDAARRTGADAIHPGYGFLSENAAFSQACAEAGIVFVGPPPAAITAMGDKARAKARMIEAGVPCVPGYQGSDQSVETLRRHADEIGYPVLLKAVAGGGGRGMRRVDGPEGLPDALASAQKEAASAFGSAEVLLEKLVERGRHVEVQVFADAHGNAIHLGERDCSAQRRHQKVIEEAPSPAVDVKLRHAMGEAAVKAARAIDYRGAGTVEFLLDDDGSFYFLEMNTRLQVEHPVTELITGLDLVDLQLRVAAGSPLGLSQEDVTLTGHAIEVRLYAEDPAAGYMPQTGPVLAWRPPHGAGIRCDHGILTGQEISAYYDPMVAKVMAYGEDREQARRRLRQALRQTGLLGVRHNKRFLLDLLDDPTFVAGEVRTRYLDDASQAETKPTFLLDSAARLQSEVVAVAAALWSTLQGFVAEDAFRNAHGRDFAVRLRADGDTVFATRVDPDPSGAFEVTVPWQDETRTHIVRIADGEEMLVRVDVDGISRTVLAVHHEDRLLIEYADTSFTFQEPLPEGLAKGGSESGTGELRAPTSGKVVSVRVAVGDDVTSGQALLSLEAMKIESVIAADVDGTVAEVRVREGDTVRNGAVLVVITPNTPNDQDSEPS